MTQSTALVRTILNDRFCLVAVGATVLFWALLASPLVAPESAFYFWFYQFDLLWLPPVAVALWFGSTRTHSPEEKRFWRLLALGLCFWISARAIAAYLGEKHWPEALDFVTDVIYVLQFLAFLLAMTNRPYLRSGWTRTNPGFLTESVSRVVLVLGILSYFIVFPAELSWVPSGTREPAYYMYSLLDALLIVGAVTSFPHTAQKWRSIYACLIWIFSVWFMSDALDLCLGVGLLEPIQPGSWFDLTWRFVWISQIPLFITLTRLLSPNRGVAEASALPVAIDFESPSRLRRVLIMASAFVFPTVHILIYSLELLPHEERASRGIAALIFMFLTGIVAYVYMETLEQGRAQAAKRFRVLFDQAPIMAAVVQTADGPPVVEDCNDLFAGTLGREKKDVLGRSLLEFVKGTSAPVVDRALARSRQGQMHEEECTMLTVAGKPVQALLRSGPVLLEKGQPGQIFVTLVDLTEQRRLQEMLSHAQKMESIGRLAGGVAHDFNNILTVIGAYADAVQKSKELKRSDRDFLEGIEEAVSKAVSLTSQLMNFSRKTPMETSSVDPNASVRNVERMLKRILGAGIELKCDLETDLPPIAVDPGEFENSLMNLAVNARDAMPYGGVLSIWTTLSEPERSAETPQVKIFITDTGEGMDEETRERIFEPFFTTKEPGKGTGLGLSTVYRFVEQSQGTIRVESSPGEGTRFELSFPVSK